MLCPRPRSARRRGGDGGGGVRVRRAGRVRRGRQPQAAARGPVAQCQDRGALCGGGRQGDRQVHRCAAGKGAERGTAARVYRPSPHRVPHRRSVSLPCPSPHPQTRPTWCGRCLRRRPTPCTACTWRSLRCTAPWRDSRVRGGSDDSAAGGAAAKWHSIAFFRPRVTSLPDTLSAIPCHCAGFSVGLVNNRLVLLPINAITANSPRRMNPRGRTVERLLQITRAWPGGRRAR